MSGQVIPRRIIASRSVLLSRAAPTTARRPTLSLRFGGDAGKATAVLASLPFHQQLPHRFLSEQAYTPGVGVGKTSTGYVGLAVEPDWYNVMLTKFQTLLDRMEASDMPETAQYRVDVTKWCQYVIETVKANPNDPEAVEDVVNMGQVEELIEMADDEMIAMDVYIRTRMWELVEQSEPPSVDFNPDPMKDPFAADGDPAVAEKLRKGMEAMKQEKK